MSRLASPLRLDRGLGLALLALAVLPSSAAAEGFDAQPSTLVLPKGARLALHDMNGDGRQDIVFVEEAGLGVRYLREDGSLPEEHDAFLAWPGERVAWCLADVDGDGSTDIATVVDGKAVRVYAANDAGSLGEGEVLLEATADIPKGVVRMAFLRDVDRDGRLDVVLPAGGHFAIHRRADDGAFDAPIQVRLRARVRHQVGNPDELGGRFGQSVSIPWFDLDDIDGDGRVDLVAETAQEVLFHLGQDTSGPIEASAGQGVLAAEPSWRLDLEALEAELPEQSGVDLDDLLSMAARGVTWKVVDLDGEGANELLLQVGGKLRVYRGGSRTGPVGTPAQVLKSSGNVLLTFLRDVDGDGRKDLQILRAGKLSVANVLRWLILPGQLEFDLFTYRGEDGVFTRKPTRRNTIAFRFPRLFTFIREIGEREQQLAAESLRTVRRAALGKDEEANDVLDVRGNEVVVFFDRAPREDDEDEVITPEGDDAEAMIEAFVLRELDEGGDGATKTLDLGELDEWSLGSTAGLAEACAGQEPDARLKLAKGLSNPKIHVHDIDANGAPDLIVVGRNADDAYVVQLFVRR